jgi:hypothetical protein
VQCLENSDISAAEVLCLTHVEEITPVPFAQEDGLSSYKAPIKIAARAGNFPVIVNGEKELD